MPFDIISWANNVLRETRSTIFVLFHKRIEFVMRFVNYDNGSAALWVSTEDIIIWTFRLDAENANEKLANATETETIHFFSWNQSSNENQ